MMEKQIVRGELFNGFEVDDTRPLHKMKVADLFFKMAYDKPRMSEQAPKYFAPDEEWDESKSIGTINIPMAYIESRQTGIYALTSVDILEYMLTGSAFYRSILRYDACMLHSSAVVVDGYAYLFSADSGTGKSTHTKLWLKHFGDRAYIINDDKPAIRYIDGDWHVYGTPWSGKTDTSVNTRVKLGGIVFLERSGKNFIEPMKSEEGIVQFIKQTPRKVTAERMEWLLDIIDRLFTQCPVWRLGCDMSDDAVVTSYEAIRRV